MKSGIYVIQNLITNKVYVGSSKNLDRRKCDHFRMLKDNKHHSIRLQRSYNKHGEDNFKFKVIEKCEENKLLEREIYNIDKYDSYKNGYNSTNIINRNTCFFVPGNGLIWRSNRICIRLNQDLPISKVVKNKSDFWKIHLLIENIYRDTNALMIKFPRKKLRPMYIEDISNIIGLCNAGTKRFLSRMKKVNLLINIKGIYHFNPMYVRSSKYISHDLYFTFKPMLSKYLTNWQVKLFEEYGNLKGEIIISKD